MAFSDEQLSTMRERLGLPADADEQTMVDALGEALDERADPAPDPAPLPDGVVTIDQSALSSLRAQAELGAQAHARQSREDREARVAAAVADGRISPARRDAWLSRLEADPAEAATLDALTPGVTVPVGEPIGHAGGSEPPEDDTAQRLQRGRDTYASRHGKSA